MMKMEAAAIQLVDGDQEIASFDGFNGLYAWMKKPENEKTYSKALGTFMAWAELIFEVGKHPVIYDVNTHEAFVMKWVPIQRKGRVKHE